MKVVIQKNLWHDGNETVVRSELDEVVMRLEKVFSIRGRIITYDKYHVEIGKIEKKVFKTGLNYEFYYDDRLIGTLTRQRRLLFWKNLKLTNSSGKVFRISGSTREYEYSFKFKRRSVAKVSKKLAYKNTLYGLSSADPHNNYLFICAAIVIQNSKL